MANVVCSFCDATNPAGAERCENCGAWLSNGTAQGETPGSAPEGNDQQTREDAQQRVLGLLQKGKKIEAIKVYREEHGVGLKEAKDAVEAMSKQHGIGSGGGGCAGVVAALIALTIGYAAAIASLRQ